MKTERFYAATNRSDNLLHIETDGCIVNIRVGLHDRDGNTVTVVTVNPDDESRGGDGGGDMWHSFGPDGSRTDGAIVRVVKQPREYMVTDEWQNDAGQPIRDGEQCRVVAEGLASEQACAELIDTLPDHLSGRYSIDWRSR